MVVPAGQLAKLPLKPLAAGVVFARLAPAVAAPIAERFDKSLQQRLVTSTRAALPHGDVVRRVEADRRQIPESAHFPAIVGCPNRVAAILHKP